MSRLRKSKIIQEVGEERYFAARDYLNRNDVGPYSSSRKTRGVVDDIRDRLERSQAPRDRILHLLLSFFEDLPDYSLTVVAKTEYRVYGEKEKRYFWKWARNLLELGNEAQTKALSYALWVDFFEDGQTLDEAWQSLVSPLPNDQALKTLLICSGPVPWEYKWSLFLDINYRTDLHYYIFRSILHSEFDVYGAIDQREALRVLDELVISPDTEHLEKLRKKLRKDISYD